MILFLFMISFLTLQTNTADTQTLIEYDYGFATNQGEKSFMEDQIILEKENKYPIVGVLDGHAGAFTVNNVLKSLQEYTRANHLIAPTENGIINLFHATNNTVLTLSGNDTFKQNSGSTASIAFIHNTNFYCAQLGDSAIIDHTGKLVIPTHGITNKDERQRLGEHNFFEGYDGERFGGSLLMTRAFGDFYATKYGLTATPVVKKIQLNPNEFLVFATDGVSDELSSDTIATYAQERMNEKINLSRIAHELIILAASDLFCMGEKTIEGSLEGVDLIKKMKASPDEVFQKNREFTRIRESAYDNQAIVIVHRKS